MILVFFGRAVSLPKEPTLSVGLDIAIGVVLVAVSVLLTRKPRRKSKVKH